MSIVSYSYQAKKFSGGLYGLVGRKKRDPLILNLELVHDRGWKNEFFFVKKVSLGSHGSYLRDRWNAALVFFKILLCFLHRHTLYISCIVVCHLRSNSRLFCNCLVQSYSLNM